MLMMTQAFSALKDHVKVYVNKIQSQVLACACMVIMFQAGRGTGKTTIRGDRWRDIFYEMPRSRGFILGKTFKMVQDNFLPEIFDRMAKYGFKEHISDAEPGHYVVNKRPPDWWWQPYKKPRNYENKISFINGMVIYMMSFDRPDTIRGGSFDWGDVDEASLIDWPVFKKTVLPLVRGLRKRFKSRFYHSLLITGSMPWTEKGMWTIDKMSELAKKYPKKYAFFQSSALDNIEVLGQEYFDMMEEMMDPITYSVEILNEPVERIPNSYYPALSDVHLTYPIFQPGDDYTDEWADVIKNEPLEVSFDFNAKFNSCIIAQSQPDSDHIIEPMFVYNQMFEHLVDNVCERYSFMQNKMVYIYGGKDGFKGNANSDLTYYKQIQSRFALHGWSSIVMTEIGLADGDHKVKQLVMNTLLSGGAGRKITMNENRCMPLYLSMRNAPITPDFKKDKSSEKADIDQKKATHLSDCFDNWVYPKYHTAVENAGQDILRPHTSG